MGGAESCRGSSATARTSLWLPDLSQGAYGMLNSGRQQEGSCCSAAPLGGSMRDQLLGVTAVLRALGRMLVGHLCHAC